MGYGDICAYNMRETLFCIAIFYCALILIQSTIANIVLVLDTYDISYVKFVEKTASFQNYAAFRSLSEKTTNRCAAYFDHQYSVLKGLDEIELISEFPTSLQTAVYKSAIRDQLLKVQLLKTLSRDIITLLVSEVQVNSSTLYCCIVLCS